MSVYVDGFVVPVPKRKLEAYRRLARRAGKVWREYGALEYRECIADDVKRGKRTSSARAVGRQVRIIRTLACSSARGLCSGGKSALPQEVEGAP